MYKCCRNCDFSNYYGVNNLGYICQKGMTPEQTIATSFQRTMPGPGVESVQPIKTPKSPPTNPQVGMMRAYK